LTASGAYVIPLNIVRTIWKVLVVPALLLSGGASFAQDEGTGTDIESEPGYLPASIYPAVYVFGGAARGITYDAAPDITARAAAAGCPGKLDDVGTVPALGFTCDFYLYGGFSAGLKLTHEMGRKRGADLKYDYGIFPKISEAVSNPILVEENLAYQLQNVDYKLTFKYAAFPDALITPVMKLDDRITYAILQKGNNGALLTNGTFQQFSFDWALYAGVQLNIGDHFFLVGEYNRDRQFHKHEFAGYQYDTSLDGFYAGAGWRFVD
jgi:hypothetical protein